MALPEAPPRPPAPVASPEPAREVLPGQLALPFIERSSPASPEGRSGETFLGHLRVEKLLRAKLGPRVVLRLSEHRGRVLSFYRRRGVHYVEAHISFQDAPRPVLEAVAALVGDIGYGPRQARALDRFLSDRRRQYGSCGVEPSLAPRGAAHDLGALFDRLNAEYFDLLPVRITWARARAGAPLGSYRAPERLIRIHPRLDQPAVPERFLGWVVFQQLLCVRHGVSAGRRGPGPLPAQLRAEARSYPGYAEARRWEREQLGRLFKR